MFRDLKIDPRDITGLDALPQLPILDRSTVRDRWQEFRLGCLSGRRTADEVHQRDHRGGAAVCLDNGLDL